MGEIGDLFGGTKHTNAPRGDGTDLTVTHLKRLDEQRNMSWILTLLGTFASASKMLRDKTMHSSITTPWGEPPFRSNQKTAEMHLIHGRVQDLEL